MLWADKRFRLGHGRVLALYMAAYTAGRFWVEYLRIDDAHHILGLRLNDWTSILVFLAAVTFFVVSAKLHPGREEIVEPADGADGADGDKSADKPGEGVSSPTADGESKSAAPGRKTAEDGGDTESSSVSAAADRAEGGSQP